MIFIDLDNTIYNQEQILDYVFSKIGEFIENEFKISKKIIKDYLIKLVKRKTLKYRIFDSMIEKFNLNIDIKKILDIYRAETKNYLEKRKIRIYKDFLLFSDYDNFIIYTEGNKDIQMLKIKNIVKNYQIKINKIIVVNDKLSEENIKIFENYLPEIYIGDNIFSDFYIPNKLGILTVRVLRGLYKNIPDNSVPTEYRPKLKAKNLRELFLKKLK